MNGLESTVQNIIMSLNTLCELHMKSKNVGGVLAKRLWKQAFMVSRCLERKAIGKTIPNETLYLVISVYGR